VCLILILIFSSNHTFCLNVSEISFLSWQRLVHHQSEGVFARRLIFIFESILGSLCVQSLRFAQNLISRLLGSSEVSNNGEDSLHSASIESIFDLKQASKKSIKQVTEERTGSMKLWVRVSFNEPKIHLVIKHKIKPKEAVDIAAFPEEFAGHLDKMDHSLYELWAEHVTEPLLVFNSTAFNKVFFKFFEAPDVVISEFLFSHVVDL
jgi:hypothetical protein